jgi:PEP-CTERM motif
MSIKTFSIVAAAAMSLFAGAASAVTNGFANGSFETAGMSTPAEGWLSFQAGYTRSSDAFDGSFAALLAAPQLQAAIMEQNAVKDGGLSSLVVGDTPMFSFWTKGDAGSRGNVNFQLRYLNSNGNIIKESGPQFFQSQLKSNEWTKISYDLGAVPAGATAAFVLFAHATGDGTVGGVLVDDVILGVVPEPGTYALMLAGLAGVGLMARHRRAA